MPGWDIALLETGDGGDITLNGNDIGIFYADENDIYLALFGGNIEADTKSSRLQGEMDESYWANQLLIGKNPDIQFNSLTERTLNTTPLTSQGRITIENAIKKDLQLLNATVEVQIVSVDRINVSIRNILPNGSKPVRSFAFVRNTVSGDFDLRDFSSSDFF